MQPMIEHTVSIKTIAAIIYPPLLAALIALGWWPASDFILLQVDNYILLSPEARIILDELKVILGVLISGLVILRIIIGFVNLKKEKK